LPLPVTRNRFADALTTHKPNETRISKSHRTTQRPAGAKDELAA
jgi:hypothetical protein